MLLLGLVTIRLEMAAVSYLRAGEEQYRRGETAEALHSWKLSVSMYMPFSRTSREAAERLARAGEEALREGNAGEALRAFGYLRAGLLGIRHVRQPMADLLARSEDRMASLLPGGSFGEWSRRLAVRHGTSPAGYPFLVIGGLGWPASMLLLLGRSSRGRAVWQPRALLPPAAFLGLLIAGVLLS